MMPMKTSLFQELVVPLSGFCVVLIARGTFAFLETSLTALRLFRLKELARTYTRYENLFHTLETKPHHVLITALISNSVADVTAAALGTQITEIVFNHFNYSGSLGFSIGIGLVSMAIILFGEIIPKNLARSGGETMLTSMLWLVNFLYYILHPVAIFLTSISDALIGLFGSKTSDDQGGAEWVTSEREIRFLIDYIHDKGLMEQEKTEMIRNVFELGSTPVKEIMVPATNIVSLDVNTPISQALTVFSKYHFTRLPVYESTVDNIIGMAHQKDIFVLLSRNESRELRDILRPIMFIPEAVKINQLLREFRQQQMHIAIVLNEHGSITGLITLEDVLEEIVGEISDEHEPVAETIVRIGKGGFLVDAGASLSTLRDTLGIVFETESSHTLAGFLTERLQHLPKQGEAIDYKGYRFYIEKANTKRVRQVVISELAAVGE